ncbi:hypothetical protein EIK77_009314 [Talaromyces pinophilus]|nr:hypothetical protein EIK77_009314 [Talaromyces pinophilus]
MLYATNILHRPSNSRIKELVEENERLRLSLALSQSRTEQEGPSSALSPDDVSSPHESSTSVPRDDIEKEPRPSFGQPANVNTRKTRSDTRKTPRPSSRETSTTRNARDLLSLSEARVIHQSNDAEPRYHGPTSTLFEDTVGDRRFHHSIPIAPRLPSAWVQKGLMAEAACQRHMETINHSQKKLDFDGVDPDLGMHLLDLHWNRQHHAFLVTYRPAFMRDMACNGPYYSKLLLNAIYFGASKFSSRLEVRRDPDDVRTAGWLYRQRVRELLGGALDRSDITTIQALLVMASSLFALGDERSAAWLYAGTAFRMIIDLGMHVDGSRLPKHRRLSDEDLEIRRRFMDHYEELEHWKPFAYSETQKYPGSPAYSVSTFTELCKLSLIMNRILNKVYGERNSKRTPSELAQDLKSLHSDLDQWRIDLPAHLTYDPADTSKPIPPPHVLSLL